ncbi:MAG: sigma-54 dependent transcriptional regulator [Thermodesulfobacteriota bacterium]
MNNYRVLVVDDNANALRALRLFLSEEGYEVVTTRDPLKAEELYREGKPFDVVLSDLKMPGVDGLELYRRLKAKDRHLLFIIMTAYGTVESSVKAMKEGVYDYLLKPINIDQLSIVLDKALRERRQAAELDSLRHEVKTRYGFHNIVGQSPKMQEIFSILKVVSPTDATVLVTGETGTGKELIAKGLHYHSPRHEGPLVCLNCAALSESLLEAELFGYVKGAFTGAVADRIGRLEAAHRGTLFLDEVGEMSLALQAKLLRFLQERTFEPVGSIQPRTVDVRVIGATNRDLGREVQQRRFLPDLFYRLQVILINVPPLRDRSDDIPLLVNHFLRMAEIEHGRSSLEVRPEAMDALMAYPWPGNVRELSNTISRLVILGRGAQFTLEDLPAEIRRTKSSRREDLSFFIERLPPQGLPLRDVEKELILKTLKHFHGHRSLTAKALGISRKSLYQRMRRFKLALLD